MLLRKAIEDGLEANPDPGRVFLVFVNDEGIAYNWRWEIADPENVNLPREYATRFKVTVYP
jgi:hypothetical protein